jgi:glucose/arabinose dehydrogenase
MILNNRHLRLELVSGNLSFPTSMTFDREGAMYVAESGLRFGAGESAGGCIWKIGSNGSNRSLIAEGFRPPVNGLTFHKNSLYVSEGGNPGRIIRLDLDDEMQTIVLDNLPGLGNYHTNMVTFSQDNKIYFSQGAMTNTGIVGLDAYEIGWLKRLPHNHDIPGNNIILTGVNIKTLNPFRSGSMDDLKEEEMYVQTGAFVPFGMKTKPGQRIAARLPCTAGIMRCNADGTNLELVAWGLRNSYGLGFLPDGRLLAIDQGPDDRGSRPVGNAPDLLFEIHKGAWYGWPDFIGGKSISETEYLPKRGLAPAFVLANHNELPRPEQPLLRFPPHSAAVKFDMALSATNIPYDWKGQIFVALFGDERPMTAPPNGPRIGRAVVRIDPHDWSLHPFMTEPLIRPIDVRFNTVNKSLYVLDFGQFEIGQNLDILADAKSGRLWRVTPV